MAEIRPFRALRYDLEKAGRINDLVSPPYDTIREEDRQALLARSAYNAVRLSLPAGDDPCSEAESTLRDWIKEGILKTDMDEGVYLYEQELPKEADHEERRVLRSLICLVRLEELDSGVVLPYGEVPGKAAEDRLPLRNACACNVSPICCLYRDERHATRQRLDRLAESCAPRYDFSDGPAAYRLWVINDPVAIAALRDDFASRKLYLADGRRDYEAALRYRELLEKQNRYAPGADFILMALTDAEDTDPLTFPAQQSVCGPKSLNAEQLPEACKEGLPAEETGAASAGGETPRSSLRFYSRPITGLVMNRL